MPTPPSPRRAPTLIQICLVVLPMGTIALGILAMVWYFQRDPAHSRDTRAGFSRRDPSLVSVGDTTAKLATLSAATAAGASTDTSVRRATRSLIEGALGETNMGYNPVKHGSPPDDPRGWELLWVDNPGTRNPSEIIEVRVHLGGQGGAEDVRRDNLRVAVALELAQAYAGAPLRRTTRFLFLDRPESATTYAGLMSDRRIKVIGVLDLNGGDFDGTLDGEALLRKITDLQQAVARLADQ